MNKKILSLLWLILPAITLAAPINESLFLNEKTVEAMTKAIDPSLPNQIVLINNLLSEIKDKSEIEKINRINQFYNYKIKFKDDTNLWGTTDYWATPLEVLAKGGGDCEDYAISKYWLAIKSGVDPKKLKISYVKVNIAMQIQPHMILSYNNGNENNPLILDNLITSVYPLSKRPDIAIVFSFGFNENIETADHKVLKQRIKKWEDFLVKAEQQGISFNP